MQPKLRALLAASAFCLTACGLPALVDKSFNAVTVKDQPPISERAMALHKKLVIADLHSDALLWERNPDERQTRGHVDFVRMQEGNVAIQAFTIVTKVPGEANVDRTSDKSDLITILAFAQGWPRNTWGSLAERTLYEAGKLQAAAERSKGKFTILKSGADVRAYLERRQADPTLTAGFLGIEGAHALDGNLANLDRFYDAGIRMSAPTHFFDNDIAGSAHGVNKAGLTPLGKMWVRKMESKKMIIDLAHASAKTIDDVLDIATRPVLVSHTGVRGTCDNNRNLTDAQIKRIADKGGLVGIAYFKKATCGTDVASIVRALRYTVDKIGADHVALGSDYDGMVSAPFDSAHLAVLTDALLQAGFTEEEITKIMGGNVAHFLEANLPN